MTDQPARTFTEDFRRFFLRGLAVLLPSVLTLWIVVKAYQFVDNAIAEPINQGIRLAIAKATPQSEWLTEHFEPNPQSVNAELLAAGPERPPTRDRVAARLRMANIRAWWVERPYLDLIGLLVAIIAVYIAGRLLGGFVGRRVYRRLEALITSVPVFKQVYPHVKQVVDFLFADDKPIKFNRVVVVEYPRKGIWSIGLVTGESMKAITAKSGDSMTVFIPSSPTPFTGYTITVKREEAIEVPITVDEALRFTVSGGVLVPAHQQVEDDSPQATGLIPIQQPGLPPASADGTGESDTETPNRDSTENSSEANGSTDSQTPAEPSASTDTPDESTDSSPNQSSSFPTPR